MYIPHGPRAQSDADRRDVRGETITRTSLARKVLQYMDM